MKDRFVYVPILVRDGIIQDSHILKSFRTLSEADLNRPRKAYKFDVIEILEIELPE